MYFKYSILITCISITPTLPLRISLSLPSQLVLVCIYVCIYMFIYMFVCTIACMFVCMSELYLCICASVCRGAYLCKWTNEGGGEEAAAPGCTTRVGKNCIKLVHAITQYYDKVMTMVVINKVPEHVMNLLATYRTSNRFDGHGLRPPEGDRPSHYRN